MFTPTEPAEGLWENRPLGTERKKILQPSYTGPPVWERPTTVSNHHFVCIFGIFVSLSRFTFFSVVVSVFVSLGSCCSYFWSLSYSFQSFFKLLWQCSISLWSFCAYFWSLCVFFLSSFCVCHHFVWHFACFLSLWSFFVSLGWFGLSLWLFFPLLIELCDFYIRNTDSHFIQKGQSWSHLVIHPWHNLVV